MTTHAPLSVFPVSAQINRRGRLEIGGCDTVELARHFGTPLYVFDMATLRGQCRVHSQAFAALYPNVTVLYAGKAYLGLRLAQFMRDQGLGLDVVSGGEMYVAKAAGFPPERVYVHGSNKSADELAQALQWGVGRIVVDNLDELALLADLAEQQGRQAAILLRLAPAIDPHTHRFVATGVADSKFGLPIADGQARQAVGRALVAPALRLCGYHAHIGSQIHDLEPYCRTVQVVVDFAAQMKQEHGYTPGEISLGGGWAVQYTPDESAPSIGDVAHAIAGSLAHACRAAGLALPTLVVEPGRALVARAGVALYSVGVIKDVPGRRRYISVDGGMADNIRPALYGARYTALLADRAAEGASQRVTIAGRSCESGDILVWDALLPPVGRGDIVAVAVCGAYAPAMASNYNMALRPAIVAVEDGQATVWRRRETYQDLIRCEA